ncbi:MAG: helix-turn-helix transcriptional regulator [Taibaiella sp.]|nr:helix-turn-helix transcriptional regulator [Taibaiella sp.]
MAQPLLLTIFDELLYRKKVTSQSDMATKLDVTKGYISKLLKSGDTLPPSVRIKLEKEFGISEEYLSSNGTQGTIFPEKAPVREYNMQDPVPQFVNEPLNEPATNFGTKSASGSAHQNDIRTMENQMLIQLAASQQQTISSLQEGNRELQQALLDFLKKMSTPSINYKKPKQHTTTGK